MGDKSSVVPNAAAQLHQGVIQCKQVVWRVMNGQILIQQIDSLSIAAVPQSILTARVFDQDPPHGRCRSGKEMSSAIPVRLFALAIEWPQVRFID